MRFSRPRALSSALVFTTLVSACAERPTGVVKEHLQVKEPSLVSATAIAMGSLSICKLTVNGDDSFVLDWSITNGPSGTVTLSNGQCQTVATGIQGRTKATVTERVPPANWKLTNIQIAFSSGSGGQIDIPNRTASGPIANDLGAQFTFTNTKAVGSIGDFVWNDLNGNGVQDTGEPGIAGLTVSLSGAANATTTTDANGNYSFGNLFAGNYTVTVGTPSGFSASPSNQGGDPLKDSNGSPASVTLATSASTDASIDFGFVENKTGQIGDFVWYDVNGNGVQDPSEPGIAGVTVTLSGPTGTQTTTTNGSGAYLFTGLAAGSYTVAVGTPTGFLASPSNQGGDPLKDSNGSPATVTLATNASTDTSIDFGFTKAVGVIGDFVWNDLDGDGVQDSGEPGISGLTVTLSGAASATTTTDANGNYFFGNLLAGSYTVTVGTPIGFSASPSNQGGDPNTDSNGSPATVVLANNASSDLSIDFGYVEDKAGQIGDFVWYDVNGNGVQDPTEPGIAGVTVTLTGPGGTQTATTNGSGAYLFSGLAAGSYAVTVGTPSGFLASPSNQGGDPLTDSNGSPATVVLATNTSTDTSIDFGFSKAVGVIGNFVWNDLNGNGVQDASEPGLPGVTVTLNGPGGAQTATTGANGDYVFGSLLAGTYTVTVGTPSGFNASPSNQGSDPLLDSNGSPATVILANNASVDLSIDFGFVENKTGQIGDFVWNDTNGNGVQDPGEPGIAGLTVTLTGPSGTLTTTTNGSGGYSFSGLAAGSYTVSVATPSGYSASPSSQGGDPAKDSNGSPASVTLATNSSTDTSIDFGFVPVPTGQIGDFVWRDTNGNGIQDPTEVGIAGVTVTLAGPGGPKTATTNASGAYLFTGLAAGSYTVTVGTPSGFAASPSNQGGDPLKDSNGSPASVTLATSSTTNTSIDFGFVPPPPVISSCTITYPFSSSNPRTSTVFNENEVLFGFTAGGTTLVPTVQAFYSDEHALLLGVRGTGFPVSPLNANPGRVTNPAVGLTAVFDPFGRPFYPSLFITDITSNPSSLAGDWQYNGTPVSPIDVFGTWKGAVVSSGTNGITTDADPTKNNANLGAGSDAPPPPTVPKKTFGKDGYGAEARWNVRQLMLGGSSLQSGHSYRLQAMVHDGDQNKTGGDVGQACVNIFIP